ncbi:MAG: complex I NDUFA9 subunit family protein [Gammaproteobacteria bacterium]|nr:complex I NDUFA9 subunit family protein [Gammaproteobacteria bacterium]
MRSKTICLLGGTGFVGHHLSAALTQAGYSVLVPTRHRERHRSLLVLPGVTVVDANIHDEPTLTRLLKDCGAVINLVAILNEHRRGDFEQVHVELPKKILRACHANGISRLIHMSALNANTTQGSSAYLRSKGKGEDLVHAATDMQVTSFRPSIIFGQDDHFFNRFATLLRTLPVMPIACPDSRMAPVFVGDVVTAIVKSLNDKTTFGQRYELCGPEVFTLQDLVTYTARLIKSKRRLLPLGDGLSALQGRVLGRLPGKLFTYDNYLSLQTPAVCGQPFPPQFGIQPATVDSIVPLYIAGRDLRGRYDYMRRQAARDAE